MAMAQKIHIQHVLLSLQPGGLENGVVNVVNGLDHARFRSSICCIKQSGAFAERLQRADVNVHEMNWRGGNDPLLPFRLARHFRLTKPDIVHSRNAESFYYAFLGAKIAGVPSIVHSEHGRTFDDRPLRFKVQRLLSAGTDAIFSVSEQLKQDLVKYIGIESNRIQVLYNGVDLSRFAQPRRDLTRQQLGLAPEVIVIGSVGRLAAVKNYALLLHAVASLRRKDVVVLLVGDGPERDALVATADKLGLRDQVRFLGHSDDVVSQLGVMDIFVLPSISEGMSNTLLEAMACGVAVVASSVGGSPEIIRDDIDGLLFPSADEAALREKLQLLVNNISLRCRLGSAGRERIVQSFSMAAMISRYEALYESVYANRVCRKQPES